MVGEGGLHEPLERSTPLPPVPKNRIEMPAKAEGADELDDDVIHSNTHTRTLGKETRGWTWPIAAVDLGQWGEQLGAGWKAMVNGFPFMLSARRAAYQPGSIM